MANVELLCINETEKICQEKVKEWTSNTSNQTINELWIDLENKIKKTAEVLGNKKDCEG